MRCARACRWGDLVPMLTETASDDGDNNETSGFDAGSDNFHPNQTCEGNHERDSTDVDLLYNNAQKTSLQSGEQSECDLDEMGLDLKDESDSIEVELSNEKVPREERSSSNKSDIESVYRLYQTEFTHIEQRNFSTFAKNRSDLKEKSNEES